MCVVFLFVPGLYLVILFIVLLGMLMILDLALEI